MSTESTMTGWVYDGDGFVSQGEHNVLVAKALPAEHGPVIDADVHEVGRLIAASHRLKAALLLFVNPEKDQPVGTTTYEDADAIDRCHYCHEEATYDGGEDEPSDDNPRRDDGYVMYCENAECPEKVARAVLAELTPSKDS